MKRNFFGILIGIAAFCFGTFATWSFYLNSAVNRVDERMVIVSEQATSGENAFSALPNGKIVVYFKGFRQTQDGLAADFEAVNYNTETAFYYGYSSNSFDENGEAIAYLKLDDEEEKNFICGTGLRTFGLKSGESLPVTVYGGLMTYSIKKARSVQIGFEFSLGDDKKYRKYWSEVLDIPDSVRQLFLIEAKNREENGL